MKLIVIENCVTLICLTALVLGLYAMSGSWHSLWGLLLLIHLTTHTARQRSGGDS